MKELIIELINDTKISVVKDYYWLDNLLKELNAREDFIQIENHIFAKSEIRKIELRELPEKVEEA